MQFPVQQFPILTPEQMSPFNAAVHQGLKNYTNITNAQAKSSYAKYRPQEIKSAILSNPVATAMLAQNPEQFKQFLQSFTDMPSSNQQPGLLQQLGNWMFGRGGQAPITAQQQAQAPQAPQGQGQGQPQPLMPTGNGPLPTNLGSINRASDQEVQQIIDNLSNNAGQQGAPQQVPNSQPVINPTPVQSAPTTTRIQDIANDAYVKAYPLSKEATASKVKQESAIKESEEDIKLYNDLWKQRLQKNNEIVDSYEPTKKYINTMKLNYPKLNWMEKGPFFGNGPAASTAAGKFDNAAQNVVNNYTRAMNSGHLTNKDFDLATKAKMSRAMPEEAFNDIVRNNEALVDRSKQKVQFDNLMKKAKVPSEQANQLWLNYIDNHPMFDEKTGNIIDKNIKMKPEEILNSLRGKTENKSAESETPKPIKRQAAAVNKAKAKTYEDYANHAKTATRHKVGNKWYVEINGQLYED